MVEHPGKSFSDQGGDEYWEVGGSTPPLGRPLRAVVLPEPTPDAMTWEFLDNAPRMIVTFPDAMSLEEANRLRDQWFGNATREAFGND